MSFLARQLSCALLGAGLAVLPGPAARAEVRLLEIPEAQRIAWQAPGITAAVYEIQLAAPLSSTAVWSVAGTAVPTGAVMSARLNVTNPAAAYRVAAVTGAFPRTRHAMALVPGGTFAMGNTYSHLLEGWPRELPVHDVPVSAFLIDRFEVTYDQFIEVFNWARAQGHVAVVDTVTTNVSAGVTNIVTNGNTRVVNTQGSTNKLFDVNRSWTDLGYTNGAFHLFDPIRTNFPAVNVSWHGAMAYARFRSELEGRAQAVDFGPTNWTLTLTNDGYRLPTEAEWEKAARGGVAGTHFPWPDDSVEGTNNYLWSIDPVKANYLDYRFLYDGLEDHPAHPWFNKTNPALPPYSTTPVGYYNGSQQIVFSPGSTNAWIYFKRGADWGRTQDMANAYGLYDMAGNAYEWCYDWAGTNWYGKPEASLADPLGESLANRSEIMPPADQGPPGRIIRGGGWISFFTPYDPSLLRCAYREAQPPETVHQALGFRTVRSVR